MIAPRPAAIRSKVVPRDGTIVQAARKLHLTVEEFRAKLPDLYRRRFPHPDETTGMWDLIAIDRWQDSRHPQIFGQENSDSPKDARRVMGDRLGRL